MEPEFVRIYPEAPKGCYTCEFFRFNRRCEVYDDEVPKEYSDKINNCEHWIEEIPF